MKTEGHGEEDGLFPLNVSSCFVVVVVLMFFVVVVVLGEGVGSFRSPLCSLRLNWLSIIYRTQHTDLRPCTVQNKKISPSLNGLHERSCIDERNNSTTPASLPLQDGVHIGLGVINTHSRY